MNLCDLRLTVDGMAWSPAYRRQRITEWKEKKEAIPMKFRAAARDILSRPSNDDGKIEEELKRGESTLYHRVVWGMTRAAIGLGLSKGPDPKACEFLIRAVGELNQQPQSSPTERTLNVVLIGQARSAVKAVLEPAAAEQSTGDAQEPVDEGPERPSDA